MGTSTKCFKLKKLTSRFIFMHFVDVSDNKKLFLFLKAINKFKCLFIVKQYTSFPYTLKKVTSQLKYKWIYEAY